MPFTPTLGDDILTDTTGNESVDALAGNDQIMVTRGFDNVSGNMGRDRLTGGAGVDVLTGGTEGDTFVFASGDMGTSMASADRITDWSGLGAEGDRIDLSAINANSANGAVTNEAFMFIGGAAFSNVAGQMRSEAISGNTFLMADTNGNSVADFWLRLDGVVTVGAGDWAL